MIKIEAVGGLAVVAGSKVELCTAVSGGPGKHFVPKRGAYALATDGRVRDKVFEVGFFAMEGDDNRQGSYAYNLAVVVCGDEDVVIRGMNDFF